MEERLGGHNRIDADKENNPSFGSNSRQGFGFKSQNSFNQGGFCSRNFNSGSGRQGSQSHFQSNFKTFQSSRITDNRPLNSSKVYIDPEEEYKNEAAYQILQYTELPSFNEGVKPDEVI